MAEEQELAMKRACCSSLMARIIPYQVGSHDGRRQAAHDKADIKFRDALLADLRRHAAVSEVTDVGVVKDDAIASLD